MIWGRPDVTSWVGQLDGLPDGSTRLITRIRSRIRPTISSAFFAVLLELADYWMLRNVLLNLRERAEGDS